METLTLTSAEKQLLWRCLCISEEWEQERISNLRGYTKRNIQATDNMVSNGLTRLKDIQKFKDKLWNS